MHKLQILRLTGKPLGRRGEPLGTTELRGIAVAAALHAAAPMPRTALSAAERAWIVLTAVADVQAVAGR